MFQFTIEGGLGLSRPDEQAGGSARGPAPGVPFGRLLTSSPALYPVAVDPRADAVRFIRLTQAQYAEASFLDVRLLAPGVPSAWGPWAEVRAAAAGLPLRCHFVFHISHVGSTLLSRLLGHHPALFSLREPAVLRDLADVDFTLDRPGCPWDRAEFDDRLSVYLALWSRTFGEGQTAVIKATSFVAELSSQLMGRVAGSQSVFMFVPPLTFLKSLLDGAMSDITAAAGRRLERLHRRLGAPHWRLAELSSGECVAMSWLSEMFALCATAARFPDRVFWIDFDRFLGAPEPGLEEALRHLGAGDAGDAAREILSGPTMGRYAKAPERRFDARAREQLLRRSEERHAAEVRKGMGWLDRAAATPAVREVLETAARLSRPPGEGGQTKS
jgi:hypothetical protein